MPELPEVEIARRNLARWLGGGALVAARAPDRAVAPRGLARLVGARVERVARRGNWLRIELEGGRSLFSHLGMTGKWVRRRADEPAVRWERARLDVERGGRAISARYVDPRRFGRLLVARGEIPAWRAMGPDPLVDGIDVTSLHESLARRRRAVKEVLMDPAVVAGVGNIQATEAHWRARVDPRARADTLTRAEVASIARGLRWTIDRTLAVSSGPEIAYVQARRTRSSSTGAAASRALGARARSRARRWADARRCTARAVSSAAEPARRRAARLGASRARGRT